MIRSVRAKSGKAYQRFCSVYGARRAEKGSHNFGRAKVYHSKKNESQFTIIASEGVCVSKDRGRCLPLACVFFCSLLKHIIVIVSNSSTSPSTRAVRCYPMMSKWSSHASEPFRFIWNVICSYLHTELSSTVRNCITGSRRVLIRRAVTGIERCIIQVFFFSIRTIHKPRTCLLFRTKF